MAPSAFETIFCVTTRTSSSLSGNASGVHSIASPRNAATSSPGTTSGMPSSATTSMRPSAGIDHLEQVVSAIAERLDQEQIVGRVDVEAERSVDLDVASPDVPGARLVGGPAVAAEGQLDRVGRREQKRVRAAVMAIRGEDDEWPLPVAAEWREEPLDHLRRDQWQVDREDRDRVRAAGDRVVARLTQAGVQALAALADRPRAERRGLGDRLPVRTDDQRLGQGGRRERRPDRPVEHRVSEVPPLFGVKRPAQPRLGVVERADRDDRDDSGAGGSVLHRLIVPGDGRRPRGRGYPSAALTPNAIATIPNAKIRTPVARLIHVRARSVTRDRSAATTAVRITHQTAEPHHTPSVSSAASMPLPATIPRPANAAANDRIVIGLVIVRPWVESAAETSPGRLSGSAAASRGLLRIVVQPR